MCEELVITGISILNSMGSTPPEVWLNLCQNKDTFDFIKNYNPLEYPSISDITKAFEYNLTDKIILESKNKFISNNFFGKNTLSAIYLANEAIKNSGIDVKNNKNGAIFFSTITTESIERILRIKHLISNDRKYDARYIMSAEQDFVGGLLSGMYDLIGPNMTLTYACASSIMSIDYATKMILAGDIDYAIIGACDINSNPISIHKYKMLGALSYDRCVPLDNNRTGMAVGDGGGFIILEKKSNAKNRGARIYATIKGIGFGTDKYHPTSPSKTGDGIFKVIDMALKKSNLTYKDIPYINAHATGTYIGDKIEYMVLNELFPNSLVNAFKGYIGHLTAASGISELIMSILSMNNSLIIKSARVIDPMTDKLKICTENTILDIKYCLKTSFGFGGKCSAIILERE
ncbi:MAG: beta-ketoacyl synthase N-terminal-like domain-containing protein [Candidatus Woesearchaeota archaeon]